MYACLPVSVMVNKDYYYQLAISKTATTRTRNVNLLSVDDCCSCCSIINNAAWLQLTYERDNEIKTRTGDATVAPYSKSSAARKW